MLDPFITAFNATPRLVFLPLVMLWLGLGLWSKVVIVFIGALFPILINTYEGVRNADRTLINVVRSFGASEWDVARLVVVPNAMPYIIAGLRLAIGRAVLGVVVAEFFGSESGLGVMMVQAAGRYQVDIVFCGLIVFAALSLVADLGGAGSGESAQPVAAATRGRRVARLDHGFAPGRGLRQVRCRLALRPPLNTLRQSGLRALRFFRKQAVIFF